jgi:DMSO/TMAO reductase YedYZ molybdopterin-dependent catalytic subunit
MRTRKAVRCSTGIVLAASLLLVSCAAPPPNTKLQGVEIRNYHGQRLDSVNDFRENSIAGPQNIDITKYHLKVGGLVDKPATYTYDQVISGETTYTKVVRLDCVEGWSVNILWEGVLLSDLIDRSVARPEAVTVVFHAYDGYSTSLPLDYIRSARILLAYKMNGVVIPPERGYPFMVVAEDHWGYKWCKWVTEIDLSNDPKYKGYWEQRGYSQRGLLKNGPFVP